jgi:hypothetical protein
VVVDNASRTDETRQVAERHGVGRPWLEAQMGYTMSPETAAVLREAKTPS